MTLRVAITGGRRYKDRAFLHEYLDIAKAQGRISVILHGGAKGADSMAGEWARMNNIPCEVIATETKKHEQFADKCFRNNRIITECRPDVVVAFPGKLGTAGTVQQALAANIRVVFAKDWDKGPDFRP